MSKLQWIKPQTFQVDGATIRIDYVTESTADLMCIKKPVELIVAYDRLVEECAPRTIVELGISGGGSTALLALLAAPRKLVALELDPDPVVGLIDFIEQRGLVDSVRPYFGVDQSDRTTVAEIIDREIGDQPVDLIIDDASHLLQESRASFEMLFPRLRPGGLYVLEDWATHERYAIWAAASAAEDAQLPEPRPKPLLKQFGELLKIDQPGRDEPLSQMVVELVRARSGTGHVIEDLVITRDWCVVRRGSEQLDPASFRLNDLYADPAGVQER